MPQGHQMPIVNVRLRVNVLAHIDNGLEQSLFGE